MLIMRQNVTQFAVKKFCRLIFESTPPDIFKVISIKSLIAH